MGFEVCWSQLPVDPGTPGLERPSVRTLPGGEVKLDGEGLLVNELLSAAPRLNLWRAPTDNDRMAGVMTGVTDLLGQITDTVSKLGSQPARATRSKVVASAVADCAASDSALR